MFISPSQSFSDFMDIEFQKSSNENNNLLKTLIPDEGTIKHYLCELDESSSTNSCQQFSDFLTSTMETVQNNWLDIDSIGTIHGQRSFNTVPDSISDPPGILATGKPPITIRRKNAKLNFILLVENGYKLTLTLNTDNSQVSERWYPNVTKQILATQYSSINLRSEYMSSKATLDRFECLYMNEAIAAFKGKKYFPLTLNLIDRSKASVYPNKLISACNGIRGFRKLERCDKIALLSNTFYDLFLMRGVVTYDQTVDGWEVSEYGCKNDRRDLFLYDRFLHDGIVYIIETFPDKFRDDFKVILLLYLLIIFNPDGSNLKHPEIVKYEQFTYVYLLERYLRTICDSDCEAADNHYRLLAKVEQVRLLQKRVNKKLTSMLNGTVEKNISDLL